MLDLGTDLVADAAVALARLAAVELDGLTDDDLTAHVLRVQELRGALEAAEARVLGEWDRRKVWRPMGRRPALRGWRPGSGCRWVKPGVGCATPGRSAGSRPSRRRGRRARSTVATSRP